MSRRGFTILELLIVIAILTILTTLLIMGMRGAGAKAQGKATKALIERVKVALDNYYGHFRDYPPDGYDDEVNGWTLPGQGGLPMTAEGVGVGTPKRRVKGTSSLIYFLCRPVVKISYSGSPSDPRNVMKETVGPFLSLGPENYSRQGTDGQSFIPGHPWADDDYWDPANQGMILTEIIDPFYRPLHYDKVKAFGPGVTPLDKYFQPTRFHFNSGASATFSPGANLTSASSRGKFVHADQQFLSGQVLPLDDNEMQCPSDPSHDTGMSSMSEAAKIGVHTDPRVRMQNGAWPPGYAAQGDGCPFTGFNGSGPTGFVAASPITHEPKFVGGYDIWSHGMSYLSPRDDIVSWGD